MGYFHLEDFAVVITKTIDTATLEIDEQAQSFYLSAGLLIAAGAFQFTKVKEICHGVCHSPMTYFLGHWKAGAVGAFAWGLDLVPFAWAVVGSLWRWALQEVL